MKQMHTTQAPACTAYRLELRLSVFELDLCSLLQLDGIVKLLQQA